LCIFICRLILLIHLFLFLVLIHGAWPTGPRRSECARSAHDDLVYIYIYVHTLYICTYPTDVPLKSRWGCHSCASVPASRTVQ
jgi:hypothetical protein